MNQADNAYAGVSQRTGEQSGGGGVDDGVAESVGPEARGQRTRSRTVLRYAR